LQSGGFEEAPAFVPFRSQGVATMPEQIQVARRAVQQVEPRQGSPAGESPRWTNRCEDLQHVALQR
jgi:hypothetical protein